MGKELTDNEIDQQSAGIDKILKEHSVPDELKSALEERKTILAVISMNSWLPRDLGRKIVMLIILILGISGAMSGKTNWLLILLILPLFSPKIIMYIAVFLGSMRSDNRK